MISAHRFLLPAHQLTLTNTTVASAPRAEARGVRWPPAQHARGRRHHPLAGIHPEEHGQYLTVHAYCLLRVCARNNRDMGVVCIQHMCYDHLIPEPLYTCTNQLQVSKNRS